MQHASSTSADTITVPATGRWAATYGSPSFEMKPLQKAVALYGLRKAGRQIIKSRGVIFPDGNHRFRVEYPLISNEKSKARIAAREDREDRELQANIDAGLSWAKKQLAIEEKAAKEAARAAEIYKRICAGFGQKDKPYTKAELKAWWRHETKDERARALAEALPSDLIARYAQSSRDRIMGAGYQWRGGYVGKYFQMPFVSKGLVSEEHWLLQRFIAATAKASSGDFTAGANKDSCISIRRKIIGFDMPYVFFGQRCKELFRVDIDRTFDDEADLNAWLDDLMERGILKFRPHVASWIFDDKRGGIIHPHLWFVLPEGSAVWPHRGPKDEPEPAHVASQHHMLSQVIASLTLALGGDPGGLSSPFHGKSPVSVHCNYAILNDESFPTLREYAKAMSLTHDAARMARQIMNDRMADVGLDLRESNTWFNSVGNAAREAAKQLYKSGFRIGDTAEFEESVYNVTMSVMQAELPRIGGKQRETVEKLVESCSRWTVANFDPTKMDKRIGTRGAAAHLITDDMSREEKQGVGGGFASKAKGERNRGEIAVAIRKALQAGGGEPTFRQIADATGFSLNTVKNHWFPAYVQAEASLSIHSLVKGVNPTKTTYRPARPTLKTLRTARSMDEIPVAWRDPALIDHFRLNQLRSARSKRYTGRTTHVRTMPGMNSLGFLLAGGVMVYKRTAVDSQLS